MPLERPRAAERLEQRLCHRERHHPSLKSRIRGRLWSRCGRLRWGRKSPAAVSTVAKAPLPVWQEPHGEHRCNASLRAPARGLTIARLMPDRPSTDATDRATAKTSSKAAAVQDARSTANSEA